MIETLYKSKFHRADQRVASHEKEFTLYKSQARKIWIEDITLKPSGYLPAESSLGTETLLIPLIGSLRAYTKKADSLLLKLEEVFHYKNMEVALQNDYLKDHINCLRITSVNTKDATSNFYTKSIPLIKKNRFNRFTLADDKSISLGFFDKRTKGIYHSENANTVKTIYVINGSFEVEDQLMECRDCLSLWELNEINFEALSETALLLIIE